MGACRRSRLSLSFENLLLQIWPKAKIQRTSEGLIIGIQNCGVSDLSPLSGLPIVLLDCDDNSIRSLEPLRGLKLKKLWCQRNQIADLSPIEKMPLEVLFVSGNQISSLEPLKGMCLEQLISDCNPITKLETFLENQCLDVYHFDCDSIPVKELEKSIQKWKKYPRFKQFARDAEVLLALRNHDLSQLE
jgi:Leucine-rich repeat (LRR) protein